MKKTTKYQNKYAVHVMNMYQEPVEVTYQGQEDDLKRQLSSTIYDTELEALAHCLREQDAMMKDIQKKIAKNKNRIKELIEG